MHIIYLTYILHEIYSYIMYCAHYTERIYYIIFGTEHFVAFHAAALQYTLYTLNHSNE